MTFNRSLQIAIIGNRNAGAQAEQAAEALGQGIVDAGWRIVCGGLGGIMAAACRGAHASSRANGNETIGILPGLDKTTANPDIDICIPTGIGVARNALVAAAGDAVVAIGGGSGTLSEIAYAWQFNKPIAALDLGDGWSHKLAGQCLDGERTTPIYGASSPEEVVAWLHDVLDTHSPT